MPRQSSPATTNALKPFVAAECPAGPLTSDMRPSTAPETAPARTKSCTAFNPIVLSLLATVRKKKTLFLFGDRGAVCVRASGRAARKAQPSRYRVIHDPGFTRCQRVDTFPPFPNGPISLHAQKIPLPSKPGIVSPPPHPTRFHNAICPFYRAPESARMAPCLHRLVEPVPHAFNALPQLDMIFECGFERSLARRGCRV